MNLTSTECEERNAHMFNTPLGTIGVLSERNGVALHARLVGTYPSKFTDTLFFDFEAMDGVLYFKRDTDKYWDFTVKAGN